MAKLYNLARVTTPTTGTGTITLGAAVSGFLTFAQAGVVTGDQVYYAIADGANSEAGIGTYTAAGPTLTRSTILRSSGAGNNTAISLSGNAQVFIAALAELFAEYLPLAGGTLTGALTPAQVAGLVGTTTNNNAAAGAVGEYLSATLAAGSAVGMSSDGVQNVIGMGLTAGDWDVSGNVVTKPAGSTITIYAIAAISMVSLTMPPEPANGGYTRILSTSSAGFELSLPVGPVRVSLASPATVYLVAQVGFSTSTMNCFGFLGARRAR